MRAPAIPSATTRHATIPGTPRQAYHHLFGTQVLHEFVAGPWLDDLNLMGMERMNAKFHAEICD